MVSVNPQIAKPITQRRLFLWSGQALYLGGAEITSSFHRHHALQIGVSLADPFQIRCSSTDPYQSYQSFTVAPNLSHQVIAPKGAVVFFWTVCPAIIETVFESWSVKETIPFRTHSAISLASITPTLATACTRQISCAEATELVQLIVQATSPKFPISTALKLDPRLEEVISFIQTGNYFDTISPINSLADQVHLSPSRLRHLFKSQLGLSLQRFLLWQQLLKALHTSARGFSLTQAAYEAGFADSAHLARVFRETFGIKPSEIFRNSHSVQVIPCL